MSDETQPKAKGGLAAIYGKFLEIDAMEDTGLDLDAIELEAALLKFDSSPAGRMSYFARQLVLKVRRLQAKNDNFEARLREIRSYVYEKPRPVADYIEIGKMISALLGDAAGQI